MDYNKNYYKDLGLDKDSNKEDIKKAFRKLAHKYHPDKNKGDKQSEAKFQKVNEANSILSNEKTKTEYDQRSPNGKSYSPFGGQGFEFNFGGGGTQGFGDIFNQFFGGGSPFEGGGFNPFQRQEEFRENLDIQINTTINLKQIYNNEKLTLKYKKNVSCKTCDGTGFDKESVPDLCDACDGTGVYNGRTCEYCRGEGKIYSGECKTCKGQKVVVNDAEVVVQSIFQLRNGIRNIHRGYGHQSKYYRNKVGSLILTVQVDRNDKFEIANNVELHNKIDVHYQDAIDSKEIPFKHVDDSTIKVKIPEKTKNGDVVIIPNKGLLMNNNNRSDLFLKINIIIDYDRV